MQISFQYFAREIITSNYNNELHSDMVNKHIY